jgi:predicted GNAT family acetyltransferase
MGAEGEISVYVALATFGNRMSDVVDNKARQRFELEVEGHLAMSFYKMESGVITFIHTEVPPELNGKGVGARLVRGALDQVRTAGLKVIPQCPFVKAWIGKHPEYRDLVKV